MRELELKGFEPQHLFGTAKTFSGVEHKVSHLESFVTLVNGGTALAIAACLRPHVTMGAARNCVVATVFVNGVNCQLMSRGLGALLCIEVLKWFYH